MGNHITDEHIPEMWIAENVHYTYIKHQIWNNSIQLPQYTHFHGNTLLGLNHPLISTLLHNK